MIVFAQNTNILPTTSLSKVAGRDHLEIVVTAGTTPGGNWEEGGGGGGGERETVNRRIHFRSMVNLPTLLFFFVN